ncbi:MAG TPA: FtsX-like permease family protein [Tissierellales bacterium]|nr:FtsX-like permease family protein [Tissierellales bacterium]
MNIINKYLLKSILEKKGRMFLLILSIAISSALLIVTLTVVDLMSDLFIKQAKQNFGEYNIELYSEDSKVFDWNDISIGEDKYKRLGMLESGGYVVEDKDKEFKVLGVNGEKFKDFSPMVPLQGNVNRFTGNKIAISKKVLESLDVKLGDNIELFIDGQNAKYEIVAVYDTEGVFAYDGEERFTIVVPKDTLVAYSDDKDNNTLMYIEVKDDNINSWVQDFNIKNEDSKIIAKRTYDEEAIRSQMEWIKNPMIFMLIITIIMATFIIYSAFKLIVSERLPIFGTFFSQGANYLHIQNLLLREGIIYGFLGGLVGLLLGVLLSGVISNYSIYEFDFASYEKVTIKGKYLAVSLVFSILFSAIVAALPLFKIRKNSIKDIILNTVDTKKTNKSKNFIIGIIFLIFVVVIKNLQEYFDYALAIPNVILYLIGAVLIISSVVKFICYPISKILRGKNTSGMLAFNNMTSHKPIINNITLITISILSITIISTMSNAIGDVISGSYSQMNFDYLLVASPRKLDEFSEKLYNLFNEEDIYEITAIPTTLDDNVLNPINLYGVQTERYIDFDEYMSFDNKDKQLKELESVESGIIICKRVSKNYGLNKEDVINLTYNNKTYEMEVTSVVDPKMYASGNYNIISQKVAKEIFGIENPTQYFVNTNLSKSKLKNEFKSFGVEILSKREIIKDTEKEMKQFTDILYIFTIITIIMGGIGMGSNMFISFLQRKRELAVLTSLGMNLEHRSILLMYESSIMAALGSLLGLVYGWLSLFLIQDVFIFLMLDLNMKFPTNLLSVVFGVTILLSIMSSVPIINKNRKLDIVKELKYE